MDTRIHPHIAVKLAKAPQAEIDALMKWLQDREHKEDSPPPFMRVVFGYETLVQNCCDPAKDYLDWKPGYSPTEVDRMREALKGIATQKLSFEMETEGCFQTGYDECIRHARSAL